MLYNVVVFVLCKDEIRPKTRQTSGSICMETNSKNEKLHSFIRFIKPILLLLLLGLAYFFVYQRLGVGIPCLFYTITGYRCPGCGMTHALSALLMGDPVSAWSYNPLSITLLPVMCIYLLYRYARERSKKAAGFHVWEYILIAAMLAVCLLYGYLRNQ